MGTGLEWHRIGYKKPQTMNPTPYEPVLQKPETHERRNIYTKHHEGLPTPYIIPTRNCDTTAQKNIPRQSMGYGITDQGIRFNNLIDEQTINNLVEIK